MLVLSRKIGEEIVIGDDIRVTVVEIKGDRVRLGFTAPPDVSIWRQELAFKTPDLSKPKEDTSLEGEEEMLVECDCMANPLFLPPTPDRRTMVLH